MPETARLKDLFDQHPDHVGQSEYRAIVEAIADALEVSDAAGEPDMDAPLTDEDLAHAIGCLEEFRDWSNTLLAQAAKVRSGILRGGERGSPGSSPER